MRNVSDKSFREIRKHILCPIFSRKSCHLYDKVEKYGIAGQVTDDNTIWHMRFACWINKATGTLRIYNIYCFSTAPNLRYTYIAWLVLVIYRRIKLPVSKSVTVHTSQLCIHSFIRSVIHSFILQSILRQVHSLFQSKFSTNCDLVLPFSKFH
jgi:hypothetical protein